MGRRGEQEPAMWVATTSLPRSPGHPFYTRLNALLAEAEFDAFAGPVRAILLEESAAAVDSPGRLLPDVGGRVLRGARGTARDRVAVQ
jgi:hypothetical protein